MKTIATIGAALVLGACVAPRPGAYYRAEQAPQEPPPEYTDSGGSLAEGLGMLVLSPLIVVGGLIEGLASLPYYLEADVHQVNRTMEENDTAVSLDRTYRSAYGTRLSEVPASGSTGKVFRHMDEATASFRAVLRGYGVADADRYVLTAVRTADRDGYTLYAVIHRPFTPIRVLTRRGPHRLGEHDAAYYRPYARDAAGRALDVVIDWAGVPRESIRTQKGQAILMTLASNSVLINRRTDDYWAAEARWIDGDFRAVVAERQADLDRRMGRSG